MQWDNNRRRFLKATGAIGVAGLSGCTENISGGTDEPINIGLITFQSGPYSALGSSFVSSYELLISTWNENGGIQGRDLELTIADTEGKAELAIQKSRELINQENVDVLVSAASTPETTAVMNVSRREDFPLITSGTGGQQLVEQECHPYAFRGPSSTLSKGRAGAPVGVEKFGERMFMFQPDYSYGQSAATVWRQETEAAGGQIVDEMFVDLGASDFSAVISRIQESDPDWVCVGSVGSGAVAFLKQAHQQGLDYPMVMPIAYEQILAGAGAEAFNSIPIYTPTEYTYSIETEANQTFVQNYENEAGNKPALSAGNIYRHSDAAFQAFDTADSTEPEALVQAFKGWSGNTITGSYEMRACDHQGRYPMYIAEVTGAAENNYPTWKVDSTVSPSQLLLSCEEQISRMECSVELEG